jgi:hypothetical protein
MAQIKYVVLLSSSPAPRTATVRESFRELAGLRTRIGGIQEFIGGPYSSGEGMNQV